MIFSTFEYSLAFISIILIIIIIVIIYYKKTEDDDEYDNINRNVSGNVSGNVSQDTYLNMNMDMNNTMEHFAIYTPADISSIVSNNSSITELINSISNLTSNNPSVNMKYRTIMRQHVLACFVLQKNASRRRVRRQLGLARGHQQPGGE